MKRLIISDKEMPDGYLKTTRFSTPSIRTDDQINALEALEIAISEKFEQFDKMNDITFNLTSDEFWSGTISEYDTGYYIQLEGTRSSFSAFVEHDSVTRKSRHLTTPLRVYDVEGLAGQVTFMSNARKLSR